MKILLLCSSFNGLTQRVWVELRRAGHDVTWQQAVDDDAVRLAVDALDPELIVCPFLRERVPDDVWRARPTVIIHPGPVGDRGPSSLDWAITEAAPEWGVTAAVGGRRDGRRSGMGEPQLPAPRRAPAQERSVRRTGHRRRRRTGPRGGREGLPPRVHARSGGRRGRSRSSAAGHDPGRSPLLLGRPDGQHRPPHPGRRRLAGCPHGTRRDGGVGLRRAPGHRRAGRPWCRGAGLGRAAPARSGARPDRRRRGLDRAGPPGPRHSRTPGQAAGGDRAGRPHRGRARGAGSGDRRGGVPGDLVPAHR